jgi:hypothetical protein
VPVAPAAIVVLGTAPVPVVKSLALQLPAARVIPETALTAPLVSRERGRHDTSQRTGPLVRTTLPPRNRRPSAAKHGLPSVLGPHHLAPNPRSNPPLCKP